MRLAGPFKPGEVVFHGDWDDFPSLFLYNRYQRYLIGLDPRFALFEDPARFRVWLQLNRGEIPDTEVVPTIVRTFRTRFAVVSVEQDRLHRQLTNDPRATNVYGDEDGAVFRLE